MDENTALAKMKFPRDKRPNIWRNGVLQVWVTRACDKSCFGCTQGSNLGGKPSMITPEQFDEALQSIKGYWGVVGIFGGNPCIHPKFEELCTILRGRIPFEQRGLWSNHPKGKGRLCRVTFNPRVSNLNVHLDREAYEEFQRDWPESRLSAIKDLGVNDDSRHSPPYVALKDVVPDESERWDLISNCDINQNWSAMICVVRGKLRAYFCELAGAMAMLHENDPNWPDLGLDVVPGWWENPPQAFADQVSFYCHRCGIPLRSYGELAIGGKVEQVSATHADIFKPKSKDREVQLVTLRTELNNKPIPRVTDYVKNSKL